jgi:hypothetical protein
MTAAVVAVVLGFGAAGSSPGQDEKKGVDDPSTRYRLIERYSAKADPKSPLALTSYRAAVRESIKIVTDAPKGGAPERNEISGQAIWTERVAQVNVADPSKVVSVIRHYERLRTTPDFRNAPTDPPLLEGLDVLVRPQATGGFPLVLSLQEDRGILEPEFRVLARSLYPPDLASLLPEGNVHLGDSWRLSRAALHSLVSGGVLNAGTAVAQLTSIEKGTDDHRVATIKVSGQVPTGKGDADLHAEATFRIEEEKKLVPPKNLKDQVVPTVIQAHGAIVRLRLSQENNRVALPDEPRRKQDLRRELIFERQLKFEGETPELPRDLPGIKPSNSWITFVDPKGKYSVRYPQDMVGAVAGPNVYVLQRRKTGGEFEQVRLTLVPNAQPKPDDFAADLKARWADLKVQVQSNNPPRALPEQEWPDKKVYRGDALLRLPQAGPSGQSRVFFYGYVVQSGGKDGLTVECSTTGDPPTAFRDQVEGILKFFTFGPPKAETSDGR